MGKYFDMLMEDVRMKEGLHSCMNCGVCTGVCPAAEFYNYDPFRSSPSCRRATTRPSSGF